MQNTDNAEHTIRKLAPPSLGPVKMLTVVSTGRQISSTSLTRNHRSGKLSLFSSAPLRAPQEPQIFFLETSPVATPLSGGAIFDRSLGAVTVSGGLYRKRLMGLETFTRVFSRRRS